MSDHGEVKARALVPARFQPITWRRGCVYGCPGLCLTKCVQAGSCIVPELVEFEPELEVIRLAVRLNEIHGLCESDVARLDLARLMVARGIRATKGTT